jgi:cytochrome c oxidase cbb3-type subunit III
MKWVVVVLFGVVMPITMAVSPAWTDSADDNYTAYCARCHGENGHGDGPATVTLKTKPQNFSDCDRSSQIPDDTMFDAIKRGGTFVGLSGDMPDWSVDLSDDEIHDLVKYVRSFCKKK